MRDPTLHSDTPARNDVAIYAVLASCLFISVPLLLLAPPRGDELIYHFPLAVSFSRGFPLFEWEYTSAYTPLPYIVAGGLIRLFGEHVELARMANLAVGLSGILAFYRLAFLIRPSSAPWAAAFLGFAPYYLRDCSVFYVGSWPIVFSLWGLFFYLRRRGRRDIFAASLFMGAGTLSGQWSVIIVAAIVATEVLSAIDDNWRSTRARMWSALSTVGVFLLFQAPVAAVFVGWGGLTPQMFRAYSLAFCPPHLVGALAVVGFTFAWWIVYRMKRFTPFQLAALAATLPLLLLAVPEVSVYQGAERFTGLTARILGGGSSILGFEDAVLLAPAALMGLATVVLLLTRSESRKWRVLCLGILAALVTFSASVQLAESHTRILVILAFLLTVGVARADRSVKLVVWQSSVLGLLYTFYHALIRSF